MLSKTIAIEDKELFDTYIQNYPYKISDLNFTSLFMWRHLFELTYEVIDDFLCISGMYLEEPFVFPPLFKEPSQVSDLPVVLYQLKERFEAAGKTFKMKFVPSEVLEFLQRTLTDSILFLPDRDNYDYVYLTKDLIELKGRKYHGKKNHLNYFLKNVSYQYLPLTSEWIEGCMALLQVNMRDDYTEYENMLLKNEIIAVDEAFAHMDQLDFIGRVIVIDGKVEAFTFGEPLGEEMMVVHIEKANTNIRGLYQAIHQQFCFNECSHIKYMNREEDMGLDYLRKAKEDYHPVKMLEKYDVILR